MIHVYITCMGYEIYQHAERIIGFTTFEAVAEWLTFMGHEDNFQLLAGYNNGPWH